MRLAAADRGAGRRAAGELKRDDGVSASRNACMPGLSVGTPPGGSKALAPGHLEAVGAIGMERLWSQPTRPFNQGGCLGHHHPSPRPSTRGRLGIDRGWRGWGRVDAVRKAERIDAREQLPAFGVQLSQLLGFALDLIGISLDLPRAPLAVLNPLLDQGELPLVIGIASPVERLQEQAPARQR